MCVFPFNKYTVFCSNTLIDWYIYLYYLQLLEVLLPLPNLEARANAAADLITQNHKDISHEALTFAAVSFYNKLKAADKYVPESKYHGNVTLLKAKTHNEYGEGLGGDYRLSEVSLKNYMNTIMWLFT